MRLVEKAGISTFLIAGGLAYLAERYQLPSLIPLSLGIFGLFAMWLGVDTLIRGEIRLFDRFYSRRENFSGLPARLLGIIIFLFGAGMTLYAILERMHPGAAGAFLAGLIQSYRGWGIILPTFGFFSILFGLVRLIAGSGHSKEQRSLIVDLGFRAGGLISTVFGILLLISGIWLIFR